MTKKQDGNKESITSHGGFRWSLPPEERRVRISVTLAPDVIKLLAPYVANGKRGQMIDKAVRELFTKKG